jgi:type IV pilus assembly protein PilO
MASLVEKIQKIPNKTRAIAFGVLILLLLIGYVFQFQIPMNTQIKQLETTLADLQKKMRENDSKIKKLDDLKVEVKTLQARLVVLTEQLPPEHEVSGLLKQIQGLVNQSGLVFKLWKPEARRTHASGLYDEIPITVTLTGGYHNTAVFFGHVGKLTRIVNIVNIKMGGMKLNSDGNPQITINCTAMTFAAAVEKKVEATTTGKKVQKTTKP